MNKPLYRFCFDEFTGEVDMLKIPEYEVLHDSYRWSLPNGYRKYTYKRNIDLVKHNELVSFNSNVDRAIYLFGFYLSQKRDKAYNDYQRYEDALKMLREKGNR